MSTVVPPATRSRRRPILLAAAALLVGALGSLAMALGAGGAPSGTTGAGATSTTAEAAPPTDPGTTGQEGGAQASSSVAAGPTDDVTAMADVADLPPSLPAVPLEDEAAAGDGISARIASIEAVDGTGSGPGNVAGPALRVTVVLENGMPEPVGLDGVSVDLATGSELVPASPLADPSQSPFVGTIGPGERSEGVYVFSVAEDVRDRVTVSVGYRAGAPFMVFTGSAG